MPKVKPKEKINQEDVERAIRALSAMLDKVAKAAREKNVGECVLAARELEIAAYNLRESLPGGAQVNLNPQSKGDYEIAYKV